jgi:hypothetical protein
MNLEGYRWEIEDRTALGLGYSAKLYRAGEPRAIAAREGFSTREGAVDWAVSYQGGRYSLIDYVLIGMAVTAGVSALVSLVRLFRGESTIRVVHHTSTDQRGASRSGTRAKPVIDVEGRIKP